MKLSDKIAASTKPFYTFEFFPPRTEQGFENLLPRISRLSDLNPLAISITWGAGGTTKDRTLDLAGLSQNDYGIDTILHLTCTNMEQGMVDAALKVCRMRNSYKLGKNLDTGTDPPRGSEEWLPIDPNFVHGADLVKYIRSNPEYSPYFCVGVAGYPDGHPESSAGPEKEIDYLKAKVDGGADFIISQLFYDTDNFRIWLDKVRQKGIKVPIIPGIMPIQTFSSFKRIAKLCGTTVPSSVLAELEPISHDDQMIKEYGISLAVKMITKLVEENDIPGVHFFTLNLEKSVQRILEALKWTGVAEQAHNKLIADLVDGRVENPPEMELLITPIIAANNAAKGLASLPTTDGEVGRGELNNAATWDEFPNGRFGDFKSPAYGNQGLWGSPVISISDAVTYWGNIRALDDLTNIFLNYLQGKLAITPFSQDLVDLSDRKPAVDGALSSDSVVGWGPKGGYVFQKSFVEFFCEEEDVNLIEQRAREESGAVHWLAGNNEGQFRTNMAEEARSAVTWGVFPGQEIVQTTIIEPESFLSWKDEAFLIWSDWASFYRPGLDGRTLLEHVRDRRWLICIVHHDYKNPRALWDFLFETSA
ncbi:methylenetetrahydrofolate reductase-domain-containing protein [Amanita rubescens]|nr:methylenetetrahydrofolate reductase-domain-containing protein [Amanita rubescens]